MDKTKQIVQYLRAKYCPETILLTGSRVGNHYQEDSDWDIIIFSIKAEAVTRSLDLFDEEYLDIELRPFPPPSEYLLLSSSLVPIDVRILFDASGGVIEAVIQKTKHLRSRGPEQMSEGKYIGRKNFLLKKLRKLQSAADRPDVFFYYLAQYYPVVISTWFELQALWPQRIYQALPYIRRLDPGFHSLIQTLAICDSLSEKAAAASSIYDYLFGSDKPFAHFKNNN